MIGKREDRSVHCTAGLDPPGTLLNDVLRLAESIQLKLPPVNAEAVLCKYCHTLQLPKASY